MFVRLITSTIIIRPSGVRVVEKEQGVKIVLRSEARIAVSGGGVLWEVTASPLPSSKGYVWGAL